MKIDELKDKCAVDELDGLIIYDLMPEKDMWGRKIKTVVIVDKDSKEGGTTALLDLYDEDIEKYKKDDTIKIVNGYAKEVTTNRGKQFVINRGFKKGEFVGHYEPISD